MREHFGGKKSKPSGQAKLQGMVDELIGFSSLDVRELGRINAELWKEHTDHNKRLVLEAAKLTESKKRCVIVGAGPCYDIPLFALTQMFERVALLDLNPAALAQAIVGLPDELVQKVECTAVEMTHQPSLARFGGLSFGLIGSSVRV